MKIGKKSYLIGIVSVGLLLTAFWSISEPIKANEETNTSSTMSSEEASVESETSEESVELEPLESPIQTLDAVAPMAAAGWGTEAAATNVVEVSTWDELNKAIMNTYTGAEAYKNDADYIKITADIENPGNLGTGDTRRNAPATRVDYVIDGQNHIVDFNTVRYTWAASTSRDRNIYIKDIKMYGQSAYGPFAIGDTSTITSTITYDNVYYRGSQLSASWQATMYFKGTNEFHSVNSYEAPLNPGTTKNTWANQSGLEAFRAIYEEGSNTTVTVQNGNGFILASYLGNTGSTSGQLGYAQVKKGAVLDITTNGNSGEAVSTGDNAMGLYKGSLTLEEDAKVKVTTGDGTTRGGVWLRSDTSISIADRAEFNIAINGPMDGENAITLGSDSKFNVSDEGKLTIDLKNQGTNTRDVITAGADSEFVVGKKSTFNIKLHDGTGVRNLINVGARGIFRFADAYSIDLDARANTNAHLINMTNPGHFIADVQKVSAWVKTPVSDDPFKIWNPIYGVDVTYSGRNTTNVLGQSVTTLVTNDFLANYRTTATGTPHAGFSRVLYEYIPDVIIGLNQPTDNPAETSSKVLSGVVNPDPDYMNGTAILFYLVVDENDPSKDVLLTPATTDSPIEGDSRKFHTIADPTTGSFSYTLPAGVTLEAGQKIKAVGWLNGKEAFDIKTVLDTTPPAGDPRTVHSAVGETAPAPSEFVQNPTDTNPVTPNFGYEFAEENTPAQVAAMMATQGEYDVYVYLLDEAVDATGAPAPNKTKIKSKLIVHETLNALTAKDVEASATILNGMTEAQLKAYIIQESEAASYKIVDGVQTDLTDKIQVTDLGGLTTSSTGGSYKVTLTVTAADSGLATDLTKEITVTFLDETAPTGTGKLTLAPKGNAAYIRDETDLTKFLLDWNDDVTPKDQVTVRFADNTDFDAIVANTGDSEFFVILTDLAGNDSAPIRVPVYVVDSMPNGSVAVEGNDFRVDYSDWTTNTATADTLRAYVIAQGNVRAWEVINNALENVTDDKAKLTIDASAVGTDEEQAYPIVLTVTSNGDTATHTIYVTFNDKTKPTGTGKFTIIDLGDKAAIENAADYKAFLNAYSDNISANDKITASLKPGQDIANIVSKQGNASFIVNLTDEAGNVGEVVVPIFVKDKAVSSDKYILDGSDFAVAAKDYPTSDADILTMIRDKGKLELWEFDATSNTKLDPTLISIDKGTLPGPATGGGVVPDGAYKVTLSYGSGTSKVEKEITVTINKSISTVNVEFIDDKGQKLRDPIAVSGNIGGTVDLTTNTAVQDVITALLGENYQVKTSPSPEDAIPVTENASTVQYVFNGTLFIYSYPTSIDFGTRNAGIFGVRVDNPSFDDKLVVWDNRTTPTSWTLKARLDDYLTSGSGTGTKVLPDAIRYRVGDGKDSEIILNDTDQDITVDTHSTPGQYDVSEKWATGERGFKLDVPAGAVRELGEYKATIVWTLGETK
ncbi:pectate lyase-like adhesive domain-containing protein [Enterococcus sp. LJL51]|uniref:pectate lyase-like adhesive domain-containing protein n=1 Tax=Enterococcus sp. LJL51 TaxID=3416656 RepID=UPI003CE9366E